MLLLGENQGEIPKIEKSRSLKKSLVCPIDTTEVPDDMPEQQAVLPLPKSLQSYTLLYQLF